MKKTTDGTFTVILDDGSKLSMDLAKVQKFIATDKRKYVVKNPKGETAFKKVFKG